MPPDDTAAPPPPEWAPPADLLDALGELLLARARRREGMFDSPKRLRRADGPGEDKRPGPGDHHRGRVRGNYHASAH
jgi:hypothetical protein